MRELRNDRLLHWQLAAHQRLSQMSGFDAFNDEPKSISEVARYFNVHPDSVRRWILRGVRGRKLGSTMIGGRRWVYRIHLEEFLRDRSAVQQLNGSQQAADAAIAGAVLDSVGVR